MKSCYIRGLPRQATPEARRSSFLRGLVTCMAVAASIEGVSADETSSYRGACDASAAVLLDSRHFVLGEDESDTLAVYRVGQREAVATLDLSSYLGNRSASGKVKEADIEGAARMGDTIYWIASHGRDRKGNVEAGRHRIFGTSISSVNGVPQPRALSSGPYIGLLDAVAEDSNLSLLKEASRFAPESAGGLNIEGLAATPDGALLIGFRNPIPEGRALVLPLSNPKAVVTGGAKPVFGALRKLDLGGRGIRSLEQVHGGYAIVAGPHDDGEGFAGKPVFVLYFWDGKSDKPSLIPEVSFGSLRPEAIFLQREPPRLHVLSDDGGIVKDGAECKKLPVTAREFRSMLIPIPASMR